MPNYCNFEMKVRGKKENINTLYKWLSAEYNYSDKNTGIKCWNWKEGAPYGTLEEEYKIPCEHHIGYRVFECNCENEIEEDYTFMYGYCAWSVYSCMFEGIVGTYMGDKDYEDEIEEKYAISLLDACRELELDVELFSEEPGCAFSEHYYIEKGELMENECVEFMEYYIEDVEADEEFYSPLSDEVKEQIKLAKENGLEWARICENIDDCGNWNWGYI